MFFFSSLKLQYCRTFVLVNKLLKSFSKHLFFKSDGGHAISRQEKRRLPKSTARFPTKKRWHIPPPVRLFWDSPPPPPESVPTYGRTLTDVTTRISRIDRLPNLLSNGASLLTLIAFSLIYKQFRQLVDI